MGLGIFSEKKIRIILMQNRIRIWFFKGEVGFDTLHLSLPTLPDSTRPVRPVNHSSLLVPYKNDLKIFNKAPYGFKPRHCWSPALPKSNDNIPCLSPEIKSLNTWFSWRPGWRHRSSKQAERTGRHPICFRRQAWLCGEWRVSVSDCSCRLTCLPSPGCRLL